MKRKALRSIACLMLIGMVWSCSNESDTVMSDSKETSLRDSFQKSGGVWDGVIAEENNGQIIITADEDALIAGLNNALERQNPDDPAKVTSLTIIRIIATNDPADAAYFLIGDGRSASGSRISAGVPLSPGGGSGNTKFLASGGFVSAGEPKPVSCWGCGTGCFLEYYNVDGHRVPYCNSAGCGPICTKIED
jgi:hypothetical protein